MLLTTLILTGSIIAMLIAVVVIAFYDAYRPRCYESCPAVPPLQEQDFDMTYEEVKTYYYRIRGQLHTLNEQSPWLSVGGDCDRKALQTIAFLHSQDGKHPFTLVDFRMEVDPEEELVLRLDVGDTTIPNLAAIESCFDFDSKGFLQHILTEQVTMAGQGNAWSTNAQRKDALKEELRRSELGPKQEAVIRSPTSRAGHVKPAQKKEFMREVLTL